MNEIHFKETVIIVPREIQTSIEEKKSNFVKNSNLNLKYAIVFSVS